MYLVRAKMNQHLYLTKNIHMSYLETLKLIINSTAGNLSTPFNAGTGYKFYYLKKKFQLTYTENLSINIYFAIFTNLFYLFLIIVVSFINYLTKNVLFLKFILFWTIIFFLSIFTLFLLSKKYNVDSKNFLKSYSINSLDLSFLKIINLSLYISANIVISVASHIYLFKLLNLQVDTLQIIAYVCLVGLASIIKFTPGNFGITEGVLIIANLYHGLAAIEVIVASLIFNFLSWVNILIFYFILKIQEFYSRNSK
jgi:uncharacterized membrane protein YbhN (UPF0104 family)